MLMKWSHLEYELQPLNAKPNSSEPLLAISNMISIDQVISLQRF